MKKQQYNFFPTLLNDYYDYQTEKMYGEKYAVTEQDLIDKLNKVPFEETEAMTRGKRFEDVLQNPELGYSCGGFEYDKEVVDVFRRKVSGGVWQKYVEYTHESSQYIFKWYGYIDVIKQFRTIDIKNTSRYDYTKFDRYFQHMVYLLGANNMGANVNQHQYLIACGKEWFEEIYPYQKELFISKLVEISTDLVGFIEAKADLISKEKNPRLFNLHVDRVRDDLE